MSSEKPPTNDPTSIIDIKEVVERLPGANVRQVYDELAQLDPVIWTMVYRRLKGLPMTFDMSKFIKAGHAGIDTLVRHRPFLIQPLRDQHPHKTYEKARQIGISELSITEVLHFLATHREKKWIYTFPRDTQLKDFSNTRIAQALDETPRIRALVGVPNQTYTKRINDSFLILRSAWESNLGEGVDADGVTLDEKDRMKEGIDIAFRESLSSSKFGYLREVSTPTLPGRGVDAVWRKSDQWIWNVKCTKCGLEQPIDYPENIVQVEDFPLGTSELPPGAYIYACRKLMCRGPLDRVQGRWIQTYRDRALIRGYHISQLMCPWLSATQVMQKKIDYKFLQLWENYVLGRTSKGESILVTDADFEACGADYMPLTRRTNDWRKLSIGIDWGATNWFVVLGLNAHNNRKYVLAIGIIEDDQTDALNMRDVISFIEPFQPDIIIADAGYGKDRNAKLLRHFDPSTEGRFYACWYNPSAKASRTFQPVWTEARLLVDRTITLKSMCREIKEGKIGMPAGDQRARLLQKHIKALAPLKIEEEGELFEIIESTGDDHLAHALAYADLGIDRLLSLEGHLNFEFI